MQMRSQQFAATLSSLVWRSLTRYGRIKYRYLLPVYRFLNLMPDSQKPAGTGKTSLTLRSAQALVRVLNGSDSGFYQSQLKAMIERVQNSKGAVIFLPSIGWEIINTQRTHHLAREFARQGYVSIFDSSNAYDDVNGFKEIEPNLFLFRGDETMLHEIPSPILWAFPYNFDRRKTYPSSARTVYDWIDDLELFPYDRQFLQRNHAEALKEATVVVTVARRLHEQVLAVRNDALYLPNGVEERHFTGQTAPVSDDPDIAAFVQEGKPIAGYYGAMAQWFDYDLIDEVARSRPDWNFLLIGPIYDLTFHQNGRHMLKNPNVRWIGSRDYRILPAYLRLFDVAMIPFLINNITLATSPLKLYEYFAGGKPVITTRMPECEAFPEVQIVKNAEEFSRSLDLARDQSKDGQFVERLHVLARENSWASRVQLLMEHLHKSEMAAEEDPLPKSQNRDLAILQYT